MKRICGGKTAIALTLLVGCAFSTVAQEELKEILEGTAYPYITPNTKFLSIPGHGNISSVTNAHDGIFGVSQHKGILDNYKYEFWTVDGKRLFDAEWEDLTHQNNSPEFHDGVVAMRKSGVRQPIYLLYADGKSKMIPSSESWMGVTNFMDGLAIALGPITTGKAFYIDRNGNKVFPNIVMNGMPLGGIRPLRDGLRAFCLDFEKWGYIDSKGVIKFPAEFKEAGNFSEGYAWVVTKDDVKQLIDKTGKSVFQLNDRTINTSEVVNGIFYVSDPVESDMSYYDIKGNKLLTVKDGNRFCDGYAYIYNPESLWDEETDITIINKDMMSVGSLPKEIIEPSEITEHKPVFNAEGFATVYSGLIYQGSSVIRPEGKVVMRRFLNTETGSNCDNFSAVSNCGYVKARIIFNNQTGAAIVKTDGEIVCIISADKSMQGPLNPKEIGFPIKDFPENRDSILLSEIGK